MDETLTPLPRCARTPRRGVTRALLVMPLTLAGGVGNGGVHNEGGSATTYRDSSQRGPVSGVDIEGQDIVAMTDAMMRDLLPVPLLAAAATPPPVIIDAAHFTNDSGQRVGHNLIADDLRVVWRAPPRAASLSSAASIARWSPPNAISSVTAKSTARRARR